MERALLRPFLPLDPAAGGDQSRYCEGILRERRSQGRLRCTEARAEARPADPDQRRNSVDEEVTTGHPPVSQRAALSGGSLFLRRPSRPADPVVGKSILKSLLR